jgi:signal transduction histidine kinase
MPEESYPRLISLAVHELRTPAGVVGGYLRMLQRDTEDPPSDRHRKLIDEAERSCARLVGIIAALSEIAKLDEGLVSMASQETDLFVMAANAAGGVQEPAEHGVHLEVRGQNTGAPMKGDRDRLEAAFAAVFHAIVREKVGPCTVVVDRRLVEEGGRRSAVIVVAEASAVQAAYDAPPGSFDEKRGGVGLSLPLARRVIEAHRGRLWSPAVSGSGGSGRGTFDQRSARGAAIVAFPI